MPQTPDWGLDYPTLADLPNVPLDLQRLATSADAALSQHTAFYPGVQSEDVAVSTNVTTILRWNFDLPAGWVSAIGYLSWSARQWAPTGEHVRTAYRTQYDGANYGPEIRQSVYVPSPNSAPAAMINAQRLMSNVTPGSHRVAVNGSVDVGPKSGTTIGSQFWFLILLRTG